MADDLVKRLRDLNRRDSYADKCEAAVYIEKLEAALLDLSDGYECCPVSRSMRAIARKALEGKDD
jgi:hypothetical protein